MKTTAMVAAAALGAAGAASGQVSEYFVLSGDQATFTVIQGGAVVRSWGVAPGTHQYQYPIVVMETIRTMGANPGDLGGEYTLTGGDLGTRYSHPAGPQRCWDGATDGTSHFSIDSNGMVWRFDRTWQNPVSLFDAGSLGSLAYDAADDTLWVSQFSTAEIAHYSLSGAVLGRFSTGHTQNMALALDPADDTLWLHDRNAQGTFEQWTRAGVMLQRIAVPGLSGQNALAGEFRFGAPCYPDCDTSTGVGILDIFDFLCFQNRYAAGSPYACDCDTSTGVGVCDIFDFTCFQNAYAAGCP